MSTEKTERKEGYYWVKVKSRGGSTYGGGYPKWIIREYTPANAEDEMMEFWSDGLEDLYDVEKDYVEINETRIPAPDEVDNLQWLFADLVRQGLKFTYDPATKVCNIFHKEPARITGITVSAGFDFDDKNKPDA